MSDVAEKEATKQNLFKKKADEIICKIFPNPITGVVIVNLQNEGAKDSRLDVYDLQGRLIIHETINSGLNYIDFKDNKGIFIIKVTSNTHATTSKVFIE